MLLFFSAFAQTDTLPVFSLVDSSNWAIGGSQSEALDFEQSLPFSNGAVATVLQNQLALPLKMYGPASLATTTLRGGGANHLAVRWNGLQLNNPLNGTVDLNLVPTFLLDGARLETGGNAAVRGGNSLAGTLDLRTDPKPRSDWNTRVRYGSFGNWEAGLGGAHRFNDRINASLRVIHQRGRNNFPRPDGSPTPNARAQLTGLTYHLRYQLPRWQVQTFGWLQDADRRIPPSSTQVNDHARQQDRFGRFGLNIEQQRKNRRSNGKIGFQDERLWFESDVVPLAYSRSQRTEASWRESLLADDHRWQLESGLIFDRGFTEDIGGWRDRQNLYLQANYRHYYGNWNTQGNFRQELVDGALILPVFSLRQAFQATEQHLLAASFAHNFTLPTLNDLYWSDAFARGNPDLLPERGWNAELRYRFAGAVHLTLYQQRTDERILWLPDASGVYSPRNQRRVRARGVELKLERREKWRGFAWTTDVNYRYTEARITRIRAGDPASSLGKQLPYVPRHAATANLSLQRQNWSLSTSQQFFGRRFTLTDNSQRLPAYFLSDFSVRYRRGKWTYFATLHNAFDQRYEGIAARPLPGRNFRIGFLRR